MINWMRRLCVKKRAPYLSGWLQTNNGTYFEPLLSDIPALTQRPHIGDFGKAKRECRAYSPAQDFHLDDPATSCDTKPVRSKSVSRCMSTALEAISKKDHAWELVNIGAEYGLTGDAPMEFVAKLQEAYPDIFR